MSQTMMLPVIQPIDELLMAEREAAIVEKMQRMGFYTLGLGTVEEFHRAARPELAWDDWSI